MESGFLHQFVQQLINGISLGSIYALIALGYTMIYGILKLINFAHGDIYMLGAYIGFVCTSILKLSFLPALIVSMIGAALAGMVIERVPHAECTPYRHPDHGYRRFILFGKCDDPVCVPPAPYFPCRIYGHGISCRRLGGEQPADCNPDQCPGVDGCPYLYCKPDQSRQGHARGVL